MVDIMYDYHKTPKIALGVSKWRLKWLDFLGYSTKPVSQHHTDFDKYYARAAWWDDDLERHKLYTKLRETLETKLSSLQNLLSRLKEDKDRPQYLHMTEYDALRTAINT